MRDKVESGETELTCERLCKALRTCGRHECRRVCCPMAFKAKSKGGKRRDDRAAGQHGRSRGGRAACVPLDMRQDAQLWLARLSEKDHKGACGRCLQASYDEVGRSRNRDKGPADWSSSSATAVTRSFTRRSPAVRRSIACTRVPARRPSAVTQDAALVPRVSRLSTVPVLDLEAVRLRQGSVGQERSMCAGPRLLRFRYAVRRSSAASTSVTGPAIPQEESVPPCSQVCGKPKRARASTRARRHATRLPSVPKTTLARRSSCSRAHAVISKTRTSCGATATNPTSREDCALKCNSECLVKQRNARLADALGIKVEGRGEHVWPDDLKAFAAANSAFVLMVEGKFKEFFASSRQTMILPHSTSFSRVSSIAHADLQCPSRSARLCLPGRRVQARSGAHRPGAHTSVMIRRRVDTRVPTPLLSSMVSQPSPSVFRRLGQSPRWSSSRRISYWVWRMGKSSSPASTLTQPAASSASSSFAAASSAARSGHPPASAGGHSLSAAPSASATPRSSRPVTPVRPSSVRRSGNQGRRRWVNRGRRLGLSGDEA